MQAGGKAIAALKGGDVVTEETEGAEAVGSGAGGVAIPGGEGGGIAGGEQGGDVIDDGVAGFGEFGGVADGGLQFVEQVAAGLPDEEGALLPGGQVGVTNGAAVEVGGEDGFDIGVVV